MGKKSKRNTSISKKQKSARVQQCGVANSSAISTNDVAAVVSREIERTSDSIRRDPIDSLVDLLQKKDYDGIIKLESDVVLRATALEGTEPQTASSLYFMIARAFVETGLSSMVAREKATHYLERSFALSEKVMVHECVRLLVPLYLQEGRRDEAVAAVKRLHASIQKHESIDPDVILSIATDFYHALLNERV